MEAVVRRLIGEVAGRLRRNGMRARCITVKIRYTDFRTITRSRTLRTPTCLDTEILSVTKQLLRKNVTAGDTVRLLGVSASGLETSGWQESIFDFEKRSSMQKLYEGIDQLRQKYGDQAIAIGNKQKPH